MIKVPSSIIVRSIRSKCVPCRLSLAGTPSSAPSGIHGKFIDTVARNGYMTSSSRIKVKIPKPWTTRTNITSSRYYSTENKLENQFKQAQNDVKNLSAVDNSSKLKLYSLFKQSTLGDCTGPKPSAFDVVEKAKYDAWSQLTNMSKEAAMKQYVDTVDSLRKANDSSTANTTSVDNEKLIVEVKDQVLWLKFNRPRKYNALTLDMYSTMTDQLVRANSDPNIKIVVITGTGEYFSSGNDLNNFEKMKQHPDGFKGGAEEAVRWFKRYVESLIKLEKFAIAAVNGPSIGIAVTSLPLLDYVICSDTATFYTPFTALAISPEACSTVTMPKIMGPSRASELLLMNKIFTATDAKSSGLVSEVVPSQELSATLNEILYGKHGMVKNCYPESLKIGKSLIRDKKHREMLLDVNSVECKALLGTWLGEEIKDALQKFFSRASAKK